MGLRHVDGSVCPGPLCGRCASDWLLTGTLYYVRDAMTADEFEAGYAARSGVTVAELHRWGRYAEPCACGEPCCQGWVMGHQHEDAITEDQIRSAPTVIATGAFDAMVGQEVPVVDPVSGARIGTGRVTRADGAGVEMEIGPLPAGPAQVVAFGSRTEPLSMSFRFRHDVELDWYLREDPATAAISPTQAEIDAGADTMAMLDLPEDDGQP
jgi:hypothetical protein